MCRRVRWIVCALVCFVRGWSSSASWPAQRILRSVKASLASSSFRFGNGCVSGRCVRVVGAVLDDRKSRVQDVSAVAVIVVAAVGVQRIFASHMPKPQCP
jgi:hypothetical protein